MDYLRQEDANLNQPVNPSIKDDLMAISTSCARVALLASLLLPVTAEAHDQPGESQSLGASDSGNTTFAVRLFGQYFTSSDVDDTSGEVDIVRAGAELSFRHSASERLAITGSFRHEGSDYDFHDAAGLFPGSTDAESPFDTVHESRIALGAAYQMDEAWSLFATGFFGGGYESGADMGDGLFGGAFGGFGYTFSEAFTLQLGLGVRTQIEDDALVLPLIGFRWQINDSLRLESEGIAARLLWQTCDQLELGLFARYSTRDYRTDEDNAFLPDGVFRDDRVVIGASANWSPDPAFSFRFEAGASVWQEFTFINSSGDELNSTETDPQLLLAGRLEFRF